MFENYIFATRIEVLPQVTQFKIKNNQNETIFHSLNYLLCPFSTGSVIFKVIFKKK